MSINQFIISHPQRVVYGTHTFKMMHVACCYHTLRANFFGQYPGIYSKIDDLPPAKYNPGCTVKNSLVSSGCIINGQVENSVLFKKVYVGNNCVIKNSIILNDVYLGDNTHIENCIVESRDTIRANSYHCGEDGIKIVVEKNERYAI